MKRHIDILLALIPGCLIVIVAIFATPLGERAIAKISHNTPKESICESKGLTVKTSAWHPKTNKFVIYCE